MKKGEITGITEKNDYNSDAFINTVSKPVNTVVVRSYKKKPIEKPVEELADLAKNNKKLVNSTEKTSQTGSKLAGEKDNE